MLSDGVASIPDILRSPVSVEPALVDPRHLAVDELISKDKGELLGPLIASTVLVLAAIVLFVSVAVAAFFVASLVLSTLLRDNVVRCAAASISAKELVQQRLDLLLHIHLN